MDNWDEVGGAFSSRMETDETAVKGEASDLCERESRARLFQANLEQRGSYGEMDAQPRIPEPLEEEESSSNVRHSSPEDCETGQYGIRRAEREQGRGEWHRVKLNVGGEIFETSMETLKLDWQSMLAAKVSRYMKDADEIIWIDRDPGRFRHVLNYLRTRTIWLDDVSELRAIQEEADFFNLTGLYKMCEEKIQETLHLHDETKRMLLKLEDLHGHLKTLTENLENLRTVQRKDPISGVRRRRLDYDEPAFRMDDPVFRMDEDF